MTIYSGDELPFVSPDLPGTGGEFRAFPEDFIVEEIPAYEPCGQGSHLFLWIEKREKNTRDAVQEIAALLGIQEREIGCAGMKDRHALTRQYLSVPASGTDLSRLNALRNLPEGAELRILKSALHGNKLKTGHLKGNRFSIRIRNAVPDAFERAETIAGWLSEHGLPNAYGSQRFGRDGMNAVRGRSLVMKSGSALGNRFLRRLCISAYQSMLFNRVLARRMSDGLFETAIEGDLMKKSGTGGLFVSQDPAVDGTRTKSFEISPTGPVFGHRMMLPAGEELAREESVLAEEGITLDSFRHLKGDAEGSRRPMRIRVSPRIFGEKSGTIRLEFELPKGSFATVLLREIMKTGAAELPEQLDEA